MKKMVFMFPGVGSQCTGMGKDFYENFKIARETFEEASDVLNVDFCRLCFSTAAKTELAELENSQIALLTVSTATHRVYMEEIGLVPQYYLGHSLGEYSALCSAGIIEFAQALKVVRERGKILKKAAATMDGMMAWVINLDSNITGKLCRESFDKGENIYISAYDSPTQSSISGSKQAVMTVGRKLEKEGAIVYPLKLSGPFHCPLMEKSAEQMKAILNRCEYRTPGYPVLANRDAQLYQDKESVVNNLSLQLVQPIRWQASIDYLLKQGITCAVEMGPDKVLKHILKNNTSSIAMSSLGNIKDLEMIKKWC